MKKFSFILLSALDILKQHKFIVFLLILQIVLCFCLTGVIAEKLYTTDKNIQNFESNILSKEYYKLTENFDDVFYYSYMSENYKYNEIISYLETVKNNFNYIIATEQPIAVKEYKVPMESLMGYESGNYENSVTKDGSGSVIYSVKSLHVSGNFFNEFGIKIQKGRLFTAEDFKYEKGEAVPIILGSCFSDTEIGEYINGVYLDEHIAFKVIGILENGDSWTFGQSINHTDRYIIIPSLTAEENDPNTFSKMRLLQQLCGVITDSRDYNSISGIIKKSAESSNLPYGSSGVFLINPNEETDILKTYSEMTSSIKERFVLLFITLVIFIIIALSLTINGFIRSHYYEFGVRLLNGASTKDIALNIFLLPVLIISASLFISSAILLLTNNFSGYVFMLASVITIFSSVFPIYHIKHLDISTIISGKE